MDVALVVKAANIVANFDLINPLRTAWDRHKRVAGKATTTATAASTRNVFCLSHVLS
jgi:hypothetical protein